MFLNQRDLVEQEGAIAMKSNMVFCIVILMLLVQAGCAPQPTPYPGSARHLTKEEEVFYES